MRNHQPTGKQPKPDVYDTHPLKATLTLSDGTALVDSHPQPTESIRTRHQLYNHPHNQF